MLYLDATIAFRILVEILQSYGAVPPGLGTLPGAGAQIKNQEPEFSLNIKDRSRSYGHLRGSSGSGSFRRY